MKKILFVDDDLLIRTITTNILDRSPYRVKTAADGFEAIQLLKSEAFDLVITDVDMPKMNGSELLNYIQNHYPNLDVIAISGSVTLTSEQLNGFYLFVSKPVMDFEALINQYFEQSKPLDDDQSIARSI